MILTLIRFEWLSVQMKPALMILALLRPLIFFNNKARSSLLSRSQAIHGGRMYRLQNRQKLTTAYLVMPMVMSVLAMVQAEQMLPMVGMNWTPHMGQRMVTSRGR